MYRPTILAILVVLALLVGSLVVIPPVAAQPGAGDASAAASASEAQPVKQRVKRAKQLGKARRATAKYRDIKAALADGYVQVSECVGTPTGAMGFHFVKPNLAVDTLIRLAEPEALVYWKDEHGYRLVAIEYVAPDRGQPAPRLFGRRFDGPDRLGGPDEPALYTLHAWLFEHNPDGVNAQFNPRLRCPAPTSGHND